MNIVPLSDICDLQNGFAFKSDDYIEHSTTLNCRMSNIRPDGNFDIEYNPKYLPDSYTQKYKDFLLKDGDIVIAMTDMANDPKILGVPTIVDTKGYDLLLNQRVGKLIFHKKDEVDVRFLQYSLNRKSVRKYYTQFAGGGLQLNVGKKEILSVKIPLPPLPQQQKIANILDAADALRQNDKALIAKYDELTQALFLDMFGDPFFNNQNFIVDNLENLCFLITKGTTPKGVDLYDKNDSGLIPFLKVYHINNENEIDFTYKPSFVSLKTHENQLRRSIVYPNDVLMNIVGPPLGKIALITNVLGECNINQAIAFFRCKEKLNPVYLLHCLSNENFMTNIIDQAIGVRQQNISLKQCREIKIPVPPIDIQNQFAARVTIIREQKAIAQKSLEQSEELFNSLLQKAFKGAL